MTVPHVQTKREISRLLGEAGVRPRKRFGQHFLIDGNLMRRLADSAELTPEDCVLEVGAGTGGLTDLLAARAGRLIAVEIDRALLHILQDRFRDVPTVTLVGGDILDRKARIAREVADLLKSAGQSTGAGASGVKLVANLPYQVATPLVADLLVDHPNVHRLCFTVQMEVGRRFLAQPGTREYGPLSVLSQTLCTIRTVATIPPEAFWPRPLVHTMMIRMDVADSPFADVDELRRFTAFVRHVFEHRRKTLRSALRYVVAEPTREDLCKQFDAGRRPEALSVTEWRDLFSAADARA